MEQKKKVKSEQKPEICVYKEAVASTLYAYMCLKIADESGYIRYKHICIARSILSFKLHTRDLTGRVRQRTKNSRKL